MTQKEIKGICEKAHELTKEIWNTEHMACAGNLELKMQEIVKTLSIAPVMPSLPDFRKRRKSKGLTLREVEKITGISNSYLSQLETGKVKSPSYEVVKKLFDLYNEV